MSACAYKQDLQLASTHINTTTEKNFHYSRQSFEPQHPPSALAMASSSVLKMAAIFVLAVFAGQALMATPAMAEGLGYRHNLLEKYDETQCRGYATCNIVCFYQVFQVCIIYSPVAFCNTWAFGFCKDKRY